MRGGESPSTLECGVVNPQVHSNIVEWHRCISMPRHANQYHPSLDHPKVIEDHRVNCRVRSTGVDQRRRSERLANRLTRGSKVGFFDRS
jgi:hypothetical protein